MLTGYELSTDSLCRLSHALRASQNRNKTLKSQLHHMQEFVHMREAEVHHLRSKQSEFEKCKSTLFKTARLISEPLKTPIKWTHTKTKLLEACRGRPRTITFPVRLGNSAEEISTKPLHKAVGFFKARASCLGRGTTRYSRPLPRGKYCRQYGACYNEWPAEWAAGGSISASCLWPAKKGQVVFRAPPRALKGPSRLPRFSAL